MKVGIFIGEIQDEKMGGSCTFQNTILKELSLQKTNHQIFIFYINSKKIFEDKENLHFINLDFEGRKFFQNKTKYRNDIFNQKLLKNKIEFLWFLVPAHYAVKVPYAFTVWDLAHRAQPYFPEVSLSGWDFDKRDNFYKTAIPRASYVITGNDEGKREIETFFNYPPELIRKIPFVTPHFFLEDQSAQNFDDTILAQNNLEKNKYLFYPAQFWPHKNHIRIVKALEILKKENINLKVAFVGSDKGNKCYIQEQVAKYNLENDVKFLGFVSQAQLASLYQHAFAMTYLSMLGPNNIPPLEAMGLGCPVICSDAKGMEEQLGDAAIFFASSNANELAQKIKLLLQDEMLRNKLIAKGRQLASSLSADQYVMKMFSVIDEFSAIRECWSHDKPYVHL